MKKAFIVLAMLLVAVSFAAAQRPGTGTIYGKVTDTENTPLPGVTVTVSSNILAPQTTVTSAMGVYRFIGLYPASDYKITCELAGFKKAEKTGIIVTLGTNVEINLTMEIGKLEESVTVVAKTPVVDVKKTMVGQNVVKEAMQSLPTGRDPWTTIELAPSILIDRENIGGSESGQQSDYISKGDSTNAGRISGNQNPNGLWLLDGIDITDPAALGGSALYYDFDMFEELQITTGGAADVTVQTGGTNLNMVTRRGGNRMSLAGRFFLTDNFFQSNNLTADLRAKGVAYVNKIQYVKDYGFNVGGPVIKDKLWWWGAYGVQDIFVWTIVNAKDTTLLNNYNFKLNAQLLPSNRFEFLLTSGAKEKYGRNSSVAKPEGDHQVGAYHWGSPIFKIQDEHVFGNNFFVSLKYSYNNAGFYWTPVVDPGTSYPIVYDQTLKTYVPWASGMQHSWSSYGVMRPRNNYQAQATYFNDSFLGMSHEVKAGVEYSHKVQSTTGDTTGNIQGFDINKNYAGVQLDANADGTRTVAEMANWNLISVYRRTGSCDVAQQWAAYIQDTIVKGRFTLQLGLRFDKQWPSSGAYVNDAVPSGMSAWQDVFNADTTAELKTLLPNLSVNAVKGIDQVLTGKRTYQWNTWSPRIGLTYDVFGDGKTVAKLALSQYGDVMGVGWYNAAPYGTGGNLRFWWKDGQNGGAVNGKVDLVELNWAYSSRNPYGPAGAHPRYVPYQVFNADGSYTAAATWALTNGYNSDSAYASYWYNYNILNPSAPPVYTDITTYFQDNAAQDCQRTRELLLTLDREIVTDLSVAISYTYRRYDHGIIGLPFYPAEHSTEYPGMWAAGVTPYNIIIDPAVAPPTNPAWVPAGTTPSTTWYVPVGTVPDSYIVGGTWTKDAVTGVWSNSGGTTYSSGPASGETYYMPGTSYPSVGTRFTLIRQTDSYRNYSGIEIVLNKRLSHKWFANASFTYQAQHLFWGKDYFDPTNYWAYNDQPYGDWGGAASGKVSALMYTPWMVKFSGLYQLPYGFNVSATFNARRGWSIPQYFYILNENAPNSAVGNEAGIEKQVDVTDHLATMYLATFRLEKVINVGNGRCYLMIDCFNLFNSNMPNRIYDKYDGEAYYGTNPVTGLLYQYGSSVLNSTNGLYNEILNPRIFRFGARFEF